ncbi:MAG: peptidoglycan DD-metalloendopeptidase family protein [Cyanothece sp. SIO1E1]|nr:peptidoglycan DD-metalloendopeptidase family protein [Cyanothece sp. SIO1E1]
MALWLILGFFCVSLIVTQVLPAYGGILEMPGLLAQTSGSVKDLQRQQKQIDQERSNLNQQRDRLQNLERSAQERLSGLEQNIQSTSIQIQDNEFRLELASKRLKELQVELSIAEVSFQKQQIATVARLQFLQRQQGSQGWAVLLKSQNLNEFLDRRRQLKLVYQADRNILTELSAKAKEIKQQKATVEQQKNEIALIKQQLLAQKSQFEAQAQSQQQLIQRLNSDRRALEAAEAKLARDSAGLASLIQQKIAASRDKIIIRGTGRFGYPVRGRVTSRFGSRVHPILGYKRFHSGVDFGASHGTTIRAADSGTVIFAGWYGGYGRAVIVNHGGGLTTLYAHASKLYVTEGQGVEQGQAIAAVGSTGLSTGPHLHFEVRKNGKPVNPLGYL